MTSQEQRSLGASFKDLFRPRSRRGVGFRLLTLIVLFSSFVTLFLTAIQLGTDYRRDVSDIENRLDEIEPVYLDSIALALWNVDQTQLSLVLEGIHRLPDIEAVMVRELNKHVSRPLMVRYGEPRADQTVISLTVPIPFESGGVERVIGELYVEASLDGVYSRLWEKAVVILITQFLKTFLVSSFILVVVWHLVTRHLVAMADYTDRFDISKDETEPLALSRKGTTDGDELGRLVAAFNRMVLSLKTAYRDLSDANRELERDISLRKEYEERLRRQAHFDDLTGLANRVLMNEQLERTVATAKSDRGLAALLCVDLDRFQNINDTRGHIIGDKLLRQAAERLGAVTGSHMLSRIGGDEFAVVMAGPANTLSIEAMAEQMHECFLRPFHVDGIDHFVSISIGISVFPTDGADGPTLLRNADLAMNRAKEEGRNGFKFFDREFDHRITHFLETERRLRGAVMRDEFVLHYQPIFDLNSDCAVGAEALVRWRQPDGALAYPGAFIPVAEDSGLIGDIGNWVLATALREIVPLVKAHNGAFRIAVNVSPVQLRSRHFSEYVAQQLEVHHLDPSCLELEITERVLMDDSTESKVNLNMLCQLGVRLSIDDFGTGYSSLAYLQRYPFDTLKIDRGFIGDAMENEGAAKLVETIIAMAHGLDLSVIAEGVETPDQSDFLKTCGCDEAQGYLLGRPAPLTAFPSQAQAQNQS